MGTNRLGVSTVINEAYRPAAPLRDTKSLEALFYDINPYLLRLLGARRIFADEAEELICETWKTYFEAASSFKGKSALKTFIAGILINKIRERHRAQKRWSLEADMESLMERTFTRDGWWKRESTDPLSALHLKEMSQFIETCLYKLSPLQKKALLLREIQNEDSNEICKTLKISLTHLGVLIFRAKEQMKQCLERRIKL